MARGGARPGAGRKKGGQINSTSASAEAHPRPMTRAERHRYLKKQVALCVSDGMPVEKIAAVISISVERLKQLYSRELEHGAAIVRAEELMRADAASAEGKVQATKLLLGSSSGSPEAPQPAERRATPDRLNAAALRILNGGKSP